MSDKVTYVPTQQQVYGEYMKRETPLEQAELKKLFKSKDLNNGIHAALNDTEAAQIANNLADMEIDVKKGDGSPTKEKVISATAFNNYVKEHYPNVKFNPVNNYISVANATGSLTTYSVQQQAYEQSQKVAALKEQSGQDTAPDMGI